MAHVRPPCSLAHEPSKDSERTTEADGSACSSTNRGASQQQQPPTPEAAVQAAGDMPRHDALMLARAAENRSGGGKESPTKDLKECSASNQVDHTHNKRSNENSRSCVTVQCDGRLRRLSMDAAFAQNTSSPVERTLSPVSWRHNPYAVTPTSPITESISIGNCQSTSITHCSRMDTDFTVAIKTNSLIRNAPTTATRILGSTSTTVPMCNNQNNNNIPNSSGGNDGGSVAECSPPVVTMHDYGRYYTGSISVDGGARGGAEEEKWGDTSSPALSVGEGAALEIHHQHHHHYQQPQHPYDQLQASNSHHSSGVASATRRTGFWPHWNNSSMVHLSPSPSRLSPMRKHPTHHSAPPSHSISTQSARSSPMIGSRQGGGACESMSSFPLTNCNHMQPQQSSQGMITTLEDVSFSRQPCCNFDTDGVMQSYFSAERLQSPTSISAAFNYRRVSSQHGGCDASLASLVSWSSARASSHNAHRNGELHDDIQSEVRLDDEDRDMEAYNATLRPNEVKAQYEFEEMILAGRGDTYKEQPQEPQQPQQQQRQQVYYSGSETESMLNASGARRNSLSTPVFPSMAPSSMMSRGTIGEEKPPQERDQQLQQKPSQKADMMPVLNSGVLERMMMSNPTGEIMCPGGLNFSVYDADIQQHYSIDSSNIVATRGAVRYLVLKDAYGSHSRFRFQLCKRYISKRCTQGMNCQYIHARSIPSSTWVHINENVISTAVLEGREISPEELRGGKNTHRYVTMPPGVVFRVYPPNHDKSVPQFIPSEMILHTFGASNVYSVLVHSDRRGEGKKIRDVSSPDSLEALGNDATGGLSNLKARHCAHFQFNKMCNLGMSCNFIHSLLPYVHRLSSLPLNTSGGKTMMMGQHHETPHNAVSQFGPRDGGIYVPPYPMDPMQQQEQQRQQQQQQRAGYLQPPMRRLPPEQLSASGPISSPAALKVPQMAAAVGGCSGGPMSYPRNLPMMQLPVCMPPPISSSWEGYEYGGNYMYGETHVGGDIQGSSCYPSQTHEQCLPTQMYRQHFPLHY